MRFVPNCGKLSLIIFSLALLQACVAPVPAPTRTSAPPSLKNKIDTEFISPGRTTRQEVQNKLGWSAVDIGDEKVFWGRWSTSSSAIVWAIGGYGDAAMGGNRHWTTKNILVEFDENGCVRSSRLVSDGEIVQQLRPLLTPRAGAFETPVGVYLDHVHAGKKDIVTIELSRNAITYIEPEANKGKGRKFVISPDKLTAVTIPRLRPDASDPGTIRFTMHFSEKTPAGRDVTLSGDPKELLTLLQYEMELARSKK